MAQFIFEGDLEALADPQKELVENVLRKRGFTKGRVVVERVGQKGDNYVALVKRFIYEAEDGTTFKMVGKIAPVQESLRMMMNTALIFNNEIVMYTVVLPKLNNLQNSANVTEDDKVRFPTCYGVITEAPYEFILLEDLKEAGFEMLDRMKPLTNETVRVVIKDLANYHSLSYVLKHSEPEMFKDCADKLLNMWAMMEDAPEIRQHFEMSENELIKMLHDVSDKYKNVVRGSLTRIGPISKKIISYEKSSRYTVIQQGDCWNNNILFKLEDGKPVQDVMIDYQLSKETSPASDILYHIFNCTDHATRQQHFQEWIDYYHESLDNALNNHGLKANRIFPRDQLDADLRRYGKLMLGICILLASTLLRESKDAVDIKDFNGDMDQMMAQFSAVPDNAATIIKLRERIMGIVDSAIEFGLI